MKKTLPNFIRDTVRLGYLFSRLRPTDLVVKSSIAPGIFAVFFALTIFPNSASSQIIPSGTYTETNTLMYWLSNRFHVVVNCDMREDHNTGRMVKAIVTSKNDPPANIETCLYVDDGVSYMSSICRWGGYDPDVAVVSGVNAAGVTTTQVIMAWRINSGVFLDIYNVSGIGTGSLTLTSALDPVPVPGAPTANINVLQIGLNANSAPHIDVAIDPTQTGNDIDVHVFAVGWEDNGQLLYYVANINAPNTATATGTMPFITNATYSDIAYYTEAGSSGTLDHIAMSYSTTGGDLDVAELDLNTFVQNNIVLATGVYPKYPRIAAIDEWNRTIFPWEVAAAIATSYPTGYEVWGYNNATFGGTSMSGLLSAVYGFSPETKAPCVTAGIGLTSLGGSGTTANIGNNQYTLGFYPWQFDSNYVRHVNKSTGLLINPTNCYQVNDVSNPIDYNFDDNTSMAVATANNTGKDLLAAWYDGMFIQYKYSSGNSMVWRQLQTGSTDATRLQDRHRIFPGDQYSLIDMSGRTVKEGTAASYDKMETESLAAGLYMLRVKNSDGRINCYKFTK